MDPGCLQSRKQPAERSGGCWSAVRSCAEFFGFKLPKHPRTPPTTSKHCGLITKRLQKAKSTMQYTCRSVLFSSPRAGASAASALMMRPTSLPSGQADGATGFAPTSLPTPCGFAGPDNAPTFVTESARTCSYYSVRRYRCSSLNNLAVKRWFYKVRWASVL